MTVYHLIDYTGHTPHVMTITESIIMALAILNSEIGEHQLITQRWQDGSYSILDASRRLLPFTLQETQTIERG